MKIYSKIIVQALPPENTNMLWYNGKSLKIHKLGNWGDLLLTESLITNIMTTIEFSNDSVSNLEILKSLDLTTNYICNYKISDTEIIHGTYYNGTISSFYNDDITLWDINFTTGVITKKKVVNCNFIGTEIMLDVCSPGSIEADSNLEKLTQAYIKLGDHFVVNIDSGIGVGTFIPSFGGKGNVTTAEGINIHYEFGIDGSVIKTEEMDINNVIKVLVDKVNSLESV